ncbi:uncharacterized protein LOC143913144 [Arctopsyche grandis]|uniref:uncharacterized protein LOC143913144 n=1 Tax=Arctopsyche grandis TaxID=121162 RepID=UPI00406D8E6A
MKDSEIHNKDGLGGFQTGVRIEARRRTVFSEDGKQYIDGEWQENNLTNILSCQFNATIAENTVYIRKQTPGYLFTIDQEYFIALAEISDTTGLYVENIFLDNGIICELLFNRIKITEVIRDGLMDKKNHCYRDFISFISDTCHKIGDNITDTDDILQIYIEIGKINEMDVSFKNALIMKKLVENEYVSGRIKDIAKTLLDVLRSIFKRNAILPRIETPEVDDFNLAEKLIETIGQGLDRHKGVLQKNYFTSFDHFNVNDLSEKQLLFISKRDMKLISDLASVPSNKYFSKILNQLQTCFIQNVKATMKYASVRDMKPLFNPVIYYIFKSFIELIETISSTTKTSVEYTLNIIQTNSAIRWESLCSLDLTLERQCRFIFQLISFFSKGSNKEYEYTFKFLKSESDLSSRNSAQERLKKLLNLDVTPCLFDIEFASIPEERRIWLYLLDDAMSIERNDNCFEIFQPVLSDFVSYISKSDNSLEVFRIFTHNLIQFISSTSPYLKNNLLPEDRNILVQQMEHIKQLTRDFQCNENAFDSLRNMIEEYNQYWQRRETIIQKIDCKFDYEPHKSRMKAFSSKLREIVLTVLRKDVSPPKLIQFFRSYNEFLDDFDEINFDWFIKIQTLDWFIIMNSMTTELVRNKLSSGKTSYKVTKPEVFLKNFGNRNDRHYIIEVLEQLIICINELLIKKQWLNHRDLSDDENVMASSLLISAIRNSFLYLKEQPDYVSFESFLEESTKPFTSLIHNSNSYEDFERRSTVVKQSFWYIRNQDEIDIDEALKLYGQSSSNNISIEKSKILKTCYTYYLDEYENCMGECSGMQQECKIKFLVDALKSNKTNLKINNWTPAFKRSQLLHQLARLAALWSVLISQDVECTKKYLKPHCIQILCILLMLNLENNGSRNNKCFAQVLTGQGKSLILGLVSSLLAISGHEVRVVCYSQYLAERDRENFDPFFETLDIETKISYGTFYDMANKLIAPVVNNTAYKLRDLVKRRVLDDVDNRTILNMQSNITDTVLLIDEVDVFFSPEFYGNTHNPCASIGMAAIADIQCEIWRMVTDMKENYDKCSIVENIEEYIQHKNINKNKEFLKFEAFRSKSKKYLLIVDSGDDTMMEKKYTNRTLFNEELSKMIYCAINVSTENENSYRTKKFKLDDSGNICFRRDNGIYSGNLCSYENVFNYFRLKKTNFNSNNFNNYGYLTVSTGRISYANLPKQYSCIFGVTGTLKSLNDYEKQTIQQIYNIKKTFSMPSVFGECNLKFDEEADFVVLDTKQAWLDRIYSSVISQISKERSVLVFFDTDIEIDAFMKEHGGKFDRLNVLTGNADADQVELLIEEAAISKTTTLATRGMGRGVDYKSSVRVEKNGGLHVIQTFFSLDIKEEIQIKGRTARRNSRGSYELILSVNLLKRSKLVARKFDTASIDYQTLNSARHTKVNAQGITTLESVLKAEDSHKKTMQYLQSFFYKAS